MHHHSDARLIVFTSGAMDEDAFEGTRRFRAGDFVFRPIFFAHADVAARSGSSYARVPVTPRAVKRWLATHGWCTGHGRFDPHATGDELLAAATAHAYAPRTAKAPIQRAGEWLAADPARRVREAARRMGLAPYAFTRRFISHFGLTPNAYRRRARLQNTIRMLFEEEGSLAQISEAAGFHDQSHLTSELKRATGLTPHAMRRMFVA